MRDHDSILIENFNGWWRRGGTTTSDVADSCPSDHSPDCVNIEYIEGGFKTRAGRAIFSIEAGTGIPNVVQVLNYLKVASESLLLLDDAGNIYDSGSPTPGVPILTIPGMLNFGLSVWNGVYAYITPNVLAHGMANEFVYVYKGDGTVARKAAGFPPNDSEGAMAAAAGAAGHVEAGIHIFGAVYETDTGFLTQIGPDTLPTINASGTTKVNLSAIPASPNSFVTRVHIVATKAIDPTLYTGNTRGYQFFFIPDAIVTNGTTTLVVDFFDIELLEDASHLLDILSEIPAGLGLTQYRQRLINYCQEPDAEQSNILVSYPGEPEAFDAVTGVIQLAGNHYPVSMCQELRDVLYIFKDLQTFATQDNGDVPSTWSVVALDQGIGCGQKGIARSLAFGGTSEDYLIVSNHSGIMLFNGTFVPTDQALTWKIEDVWLGLAAGDFRLIEIYNDTILKRIYCILPTRQELLMGDYQHGLNAKDIRWVPWTYDVEITSICLTNINQLIIASTGPIT